MDAQTEYCPLNLKERELLHRPLSQASSSPPQYPIAMRWSMKCIRNELPHIYFGGFFAAILLVEKFLDSRPSKEDILAALMDQESDEPEHFEDIHMESCGNRPMARIYNPEEAVQRLHLHHSPRLGSLEESLKEYQLFVIDHERTMNKIRDAMIKESHSRLRLAYIQWNALLVVPNALQILFAFLKPGIGFAVDEPNGVCETKQAIRYREKGFVGTVFNIPNMGQLAVLGAHLKGWDAAQFESLIPVLVSSCGEAEKGLDSFSLGVVFGADWNEHFHTGAMKSLYTLVHANPTNFPGLQKSDFPTRMPENLRMTSLFIDALSEPLEEIDEDYQHLLWYADRLGRHVAEQGEPKSLPAALTGQGFSIISTCYRAGFTYKWKQGCRIKQKPQQASHHFS
ncbi:hypothetical protein cyc_04470 [Cyclospora cayetanensis]|uniref:Uncharacterized protein n=1 Tax=Cyclospora cayetanensis TaxID=88456 RepID=A0A1D3D084_9EIME|nr:hypothetical protein cyc_04470 [Cyclospora cayetanensis]